MPPPLGPASPGDSDAQLPLSAPPAAAARDAERWWLRAVSVVAIVLFLVLAIGLLVTQRQAALDVAHAQAQREVKRLAAELQQSLQIARVSMGVANFSPSFDSAQLLDDHRPLVEALSLPFELRNMGQAAASQPIGQWQPSLAREDAGRWVVPLLWHDPPAEGGQTYEVLLDRQALRDRFASEGMPAGGSMVLFRVEDNGATTVLVRYPQAQDEGRTVKGHLSEALSKNMSGVMQVVTVIDGVSRIVGYHRLTQGAERLVVTYALPVDGVLAAWTAQLPWAMVLTLLVTAAMAYRARRLDLALLGLRRSERHFQTLTGHLPDVVVRYDRAGRVQYVNPAVEQATGVKPEDMLGRTFEAFGAPPEVVRQWMTRLDRVFETGAAETLYFSYPSPGGERHWEVQMLREPVPVGERPTALVITRDITERHEAEARRLSAQRLFESVFQAAPDAMSLSDWGSGRLLLVNDAFCTLFGRPREQMIGASALELGLWSAPENRQQLLATLEKGNIVRNARAQSRRPDGQDIHLRYSADRVNVDGQDRLLLMFRDVTQLEEGERAMARSEQRFRLAASHGQVWEWDFGKGFVTPSDEFFVALGHPTPSQDLMGSQFQDLVHPEDLPLLRMVLRRYLKGEGDYRLEFRARDAQGVYHWFETQGSGLRDASGRVTYLAGTTFDISARKAAEEAQRQTLAQLETVANVSQVLFWTTDANRRNDWVNHSWLAFTGRTQQEDLSTHWLEDIHPQDRAHCTEVSDRAFEARESYVMEYRMRRHDGEYRWLLEQGKPRYDADNRFVGYIGSCLDMTELRDAQSTARERGAMLEQVFDVLEDLLFVLDEQERFVYFQAGKADRLYAKPEQFLGRNIGEVMPPHLVQMQREAMARAREHGVQEMDYSLDLPVGRRDFNARLARLDESGRCIFLVRDVTEGRTVQRERERLNEFVLLLFSLANRFINLPVHEADRAINEALGDMGRFVDADRAYLFDYDLSAETTSNTHEWCAEGVSPEIHNLQNIPLALIPDWIDQHRRGQVMHVPDVQTLPPGGLRAILEPQGIQSLIALPLMQGEHCLGFVGLDSVRSVHHYGEEETTLLQLFAQMLVNIRLRVDAEAKIQALTEGLESKVAERTTQLEASVRQLQSVNRELESFTYSASHDLRTPLRGIEGFSSLLLEEHSAQLDEQGHLYLRRIQKATLHMSQLVNDLLAYSRLQQLTEQIESVDLAATLRSVTEPFRDELETRHAELVVQIADGLKVRTSSQGLAIVLRNLFDNALKFTPAQAAPRIRIEARAEGDRALLTVSDQGIGFDMQHQERIFGMFQRLHRQDQIPGTGIGLALVRKAVERMGGQIRAESAPGQGATFHIDLPRA